MTFLGSEVKTIRKGRCFVTILMGMDDRVTREATLARS